MIDQWFRNDLHDIYAGHSVTVFIDESGDAGFLLKTVESEYTIQHANSEVEELHVKYLVEKARPSHERFLIYTRSKKDDLKFIREYCETNGCLEIRYLQNYVKDKVHQTLNLNINLAPEDLLAAAKVVVVPLDNQPELANIPPSILGDTDVPFYQNSQLLMQKAILMD